MGQIKGNSFAFADVGLCPSLLPSLLRSDDGPPPFLIAENGRGDGLVLQCQARQNRAQAAYGGALPLEGRCTKGRGIEHRVRGATRSFCHNNL